LPPIWKVHRIAGVRSPKQDTSLVVDELVAFDTDEAVLSGRSIVPSGNVRDVTADIASNQERK
jgi:hypothetical protein